MNKVLEAMKERRSIRSFKSDAVPQELLDQIMEAGLYAANGRGSQNTIIIQVTKKSVRDEIAEMNRKTVSYTHLDVYKRQVSRPLRIPRPPI